MNTDTQTPARRVALVTGSGRRLGRQIALALADAGFDVVVHANATREGMERTSEEIRAKGREAWCMTADVRDVEALRALASQVEAACGRLDLLVNNAGVFPAAAFEDVTPEIWSLAMDVNARAAFFLTQACTPMLRAAKGAVVNIASMGAFHPWKRYLPYNISKAALVMVTRGLAVELAPDVRVNAVAPGIIWVPGEEEDAEPDAARWPMQRLGSPADLTEAVLFLASGAAYITGHVLPVDGGSAAL